MGDIRLSRVYCPHGMDSAASVWGPVLPRSTSTAAMGKARFSRVRRPDRPRAWPRRLPPIDRIDAGYELALGGEKLRHEHGLREEHQPSESKQAAQHAQEPSDEVAHAAQKVGSSGSFVIDHSQHAMHECGLWSTIAPSRRGGPQRQRLRGVPVGRLRPGA